MARSDGALPQNSRRSSKERFAWKTLHLQPIAHCAFRALPGWIVGAGLLAALAAIFVFNVPVSTVVYYGFIILAIGGHFLMHGSHGGHDGHAGHGQTNNVSAKADDSDDSAQAKDKHAGHSGGCH